MIYNVMVNVIDTYRFKLSWRHPYDDNISGFRVCLCISCPVALKTQEPYLTETSTGYVKGPFVCQSNTHNEYSVVLDRRDFDASPNGMFDKYPYSLFAFVYCEDKHGAPVDFNLYPFDTQGDFTVLNYTGYVFVPSIYVAEISRYSLVYSQALLIPSIYLKNKYIGAGEHVFLTFPSIIWKVSGSLVYEGLSDLWDFLFSAHDLPCISIFSTHQLSVGIFKLRPFITNVTTVGNNTVCNFVIDMPLKSLTFLNLMQQRAALQSVIGYTTPYAVFSGNIKGDAGVVG